MNNFFGISLSDYSISELRIEIKRQQKIEKQTKQRDIEEKRKARELKLTEELDVDLQSRKNKFIKKLRYKQFLKLKREFE